MIDLDHAATTRLYPEALDAMLPFLTGNHANASGAYGAARQTRRAIDEARVVVASCIGAKPGEIFFTSGGTEADNWALSGAVSAHPGRPHIVTSAIEHHAILEMCTALEEQGMHVTKLPVDHNAVVDCDMLMQIEKDGAKPALVSVMTANNEVGTIEPIQKIAGTAHAMGALMHTDAVQAVGHIPVNVDALGVDLLSMSAHKFGGPKGVGALYIRQGTRIGRFMHGGAQEMGMRPGTENTAGIVGMAKALEISVIHMKENALKTAALRDSLQGEILRRIPGARINAADAERLPGHLHITIDSISSSMLLMRLDMMGIAASAGSACASGALERSHVLLAMGASRDGQADLRLTLGADNTPEEIESAVAALERIVIRSQP